MPEGWGIGVILEVSLPHPLFTAEETKAQQGCVTFPKSSMKEDSNQGILVSKACALSTHANLYSSQCNPHA